MGVVKGKGHIVCPVSNWFASFLFHINQTNNSWDRAISKFDHENSRSRLSVKSKVKVTQLTQYPTNAELFSFHVHRTNYSWDMAKRVFDLEKHIWNFKKNAWKISNRILPKFNQVMNIKRGIVIKSYSSWMNGSYFIVQTSKFVIISATVVTLGQGQRNVTFSRTYTFLDPNI